MKSTHIVVSLIVVVMGLSIWFFVTNFDLVASKAPLGPSAKARKDPYLAAGRLVDALGVPAEGFASIASVPEETVVIYLAGDRAGFVGRRQDDLVSWVESGGHLVLVLQKPQNDDAWEDENEPVRDELLLNLGITAYPVPSSSIETISTPLPGDSKRRVNLEIDGLATLDSREDPIFEIKDSADSVVLLTVARGFGRVTAIVDDDWATNEKIGDHDHATLFWELVKGTEPSGLWLVRGDDLPGFMALLFRYGWPALLAFGVLVLCWVVRAGARFGPLLEVEVGDRRSLLEHLDAAGRFLWRCHAHEPMLRPVRENLVREIGRRRPAWARISDEDKVARLAELSDLSTERVQHALMEEKIGDAHGFVLAIKDLKKMESNL